MGLCIRFNSYNHIETDSIETDSHWIAQIVISWIQTHYYKAVIK